jgi:hypothetical protein
LDISGQFFTTAKVLVISKAVQKGPEMFILHLLQSLILNPRHISERRDEIFAFLRLLDVPTLVNEYGSTDNANKLDTEEGRTFLLQELVGTSRCSVTERHIGKE